MHKRDLAPAIVPERLLYRRDLLIDDRTLHAQDATSIQWMQVIRYFPGTPLIQVHFEASRPHGTSIR